MSYVYFYYVLHFFHETWIFVSSPESFSLDASISRKECLFLTWLSLMGSSRRLQSSIIIYSLTRFVFCMSKILVCSSPIESIICHALMLKLSICQSSNFLFINIQIS